MAVKGVGCFKEMEEMRQSHGNRKNTRRGIEKGNNPSREAGVLGENPDV